MFPESPSAPMPTDIAFSPEASELLVGLEAGLTTLVAGGHGEVGELAKTSLAVGKGGGVRLTYGGGHEVQVTYMRIPNLEWHEGMVMELGTRGGVVMSMVPTDVDSFNMWVTGLRVAFGRVAAWARESPATSPAAAAGGGV
mmetsp:Transcript_39695/g.126835  ORF Transcript_39695/g.126835 Transcript_39695/m.126835 type:complete len:141 (+) Transcript_39695:313-735(+)